MISGVDLSSFQGAPSHWRSLAGDISFAGVKFTEHYPDGNTYHNPDAVSDWVFLASEGKARIAYLFGHPGSSAAVTVDVFTAAVKGAGLRDGDAVALDLEVNDGRSAASVADWAKGVTSRLHVAFDRRPVVYTFLSFAESGNCAGLSGNPLWIADPSSPAGHPRVPPPWGSWAIHQHSISGSIDRDLASYASIASMETQLGKAQPPKPASKATTSDGHTSLVQIAHAHGVGSAHVLRLTVEHTGMFSDELAAYINRGELTALMPKGITLRVPA